MFQGASRAHLFIQHFILTQLVGKDVNELLLIRDPMRLLGILLQKQGMNEPEPRRVSIILLKVITTLTIIELLSSRRLLHQSGSSTLLSCYMVGIYVDRKLLGKSKCTCNLSFSNLNFESEHPGL